MLQQAIAFILKYGSQGVRYIPLAMALYKFIREAERIFRGPGNSAEKLKTASTAFRALVQSFEVAGLIGGRIAKALYDGAEAIISVVVGYLNDETGGVDPGDDGEDADRLYAQVWAFPIHTDTTLLEMGFKVGDVVQQNSGGTLWGVSRPRVLDHPQYVNVRRIQELVGA